jgi:hypothetical protein
MPYFLGFHLQIDADPDPVPDPAYHINAEPNPDFYLMSMRIQTRIQVTKMIRSHAEPVPDPHHSQHWLIWYRFVLYDSPIRLSYLILR